MLNLKKTISLVALIAVFSILFLWLPSFASDYGLTDSAKVAGLKNELGGQTTFFGVVGLVINAVLSLVGIVFFALTLYAGLRWMSAGGDSAKVDKAKDILESAAIGLIIVISAYAVVNFVFDQLVSTGGTGGTCVVGPNCSTGQVAGTCTPACTAPQICCLASPAQ